MKLITKKNKKMEKIIMFLFPFVKKEIEIRMERIHEASLRRDFDEALKASDEILSIRKKGILTLIIDFVFLNTITNEK